MGKIIRFCAKYMPASVQKKSAIRMNYNRPQIAFLPKAEDKGLERPAPQPSLSAKTPVDEQEDVTPAQAV